MGHIQRSTSDKDDSSETMDRSSKSRYLPGLTTLIWKNVFTFSFSTCGAVLFYYRFWAQVLQTCRQCNKRTLQNKICFHERKAMETNPSSSEPKKDEDVTVLALLQKLSAWLDILERLIPPIPIMSFSDDQAIVQMILEAHLPSPTHHPGASGIREAAQQG